MKSKLRLNATGISIIDSTPPFANTMLSAVFFYFSKYSEIFFLKVIRVIPRIKFNKETDKFK